MNTTANSVTSVADISESELEEVHASNLVLNTPIAQLMGDFYFQKESTKNQIAAYGTGIEFFVGEADDDSDHDSDPQYGVGVTDATLNLLLKADGTYAYAIGGSAELYGIDQLSLSGDLFAEHNTTSQDVHFTANDFNDIDAEHLSLIHI